MRPYACHSTGATVAAAAAAVVVQAEEEFQVIAYMKSFLPWLQNNWKHPETKAVHDIAAAGFCWAVTGSQHLSIHSFMGMGFPSFLFHVTLISSDSANNPTAGDSEACTSSHSPQLGGVKQTLVVKCMLVWLKGLCNQSASISNRWTKTAGTTVSPCPLPCLFAHLDLFASLSRFEHECSFAVLVIRAGVGWAVLCPVVHVEGVFSQAP